MTKCEHRTSNIPDVSTLVNSMFASDYLIEYGYRKPKFIPKCRSREQGAGYIGREYAYVSSSSKETIRS